MEAFTLWSRQIHNKLTDMVVTIASSFIKFMAHRWPQKAVLLDYNSPHVDAQPADPSKTIITMDFKNILIEYSRDERPDFTKLHIPVQKTRLEKLMFWRRIGYYYRRRPGYDSFVRALNRIPNTLLYLYTSEQPPIADRLLQQLRLTQLLPAQQRLYRSSCKIIDKIAKKHPAYVDTLTARVVILTASIQDECDDSNEASRYFVEIPWSRNENTLIQYAKLLSDVITKNTQRGDLHQELEDEILRRKHRDLLS